MKSGHLNNGFQRAVLHAVLIIAGTLMGLLGQTAAVAQNAPDSQPSLSGAHPPTIPMLGGHRFASFTTMPSPFTGTFIRNSLGAGMSSGLTLPPVVIGGTEIQFVTGELAFSQLRFGYQQSVKDWLAIFLTLNLYGRLGTETQSLISQGVTYMTGFELGWLLKVWQSDNMLLSGALSLENINYGAVNLASFLQRVIDEGGIKPGNALVQSAPMTIGVAGLRYAWAVNDMLGFTAVAKLAYGESPDRRSANRWYYQVGISSDFDFGPRHSVPIGLAAAYTLSNLGGEQGNTVGNTDALILRISHTGTSDFNLGIELSSRWQRTDGFDSAFRYNSAIIDFQYYF